MLTHEGPERHVSCLARHYFANARKMLWSCEVLRIKCLIAGEVKCKVEGQNDFVELKGTTIYNFAKNSYKGWLQAYLLGNQSVSYGLRSGYILEDVKKLRVVDIPEKHASWDGCAMLGFLYSVLQELQERVPEGATCTLKCNLYPEVQP